jgi:flagellin
MGNVISTNVASLNARRNLEKTNNALSKSLERLSSGMRINSAKDDAAGLQISNKLTSQINGLNQSVRNANDGISLAQTAEGALQESTNLLQRIRDLSVQSANGTNSATERKALQQEVGQLVSELNRISETTAFGGRKLLDGTFGSASFQVGASSNQTIGVSLSESSASTIGQNSQDLTGTGLGNAVAAAATLGASTVASGSISINGALGTSQVSIAAGASASDIAASVNEKSGDTGVTADARTTVQLSAFSSSGGTYSFDLKGSNGTAETIVANVVDGSKDLSALADAINAVSGKTGVTATAEDGTLTLVSENGDDITLENYSGDDITVQARNYDNDGNTSANATSGSTTLTSTNHSTRITGQVRLDGGGQGFTTDASSATFANSTNVEGSSLQKVSDIDIATAEGAQKAIGIVDGAISKIDQMRSTIGAVQNRLSSTISNLQNIAENVSAARSAIRDTDFAETTANLAKEQVLQQAGLSMLAQANASGQSVLSLLQ